MRRLLLLLLALLRDVRRAAPVLTGTSRRCREDRAAVRAASCCRTERARTHACGAAQSQLQRRPEPERALIQACCGRVERAVAAAETSAALRLRGLREAKTESAAADCA